MDSVLAGKILFRNLVHFKKLEADPRGDIAEGTHIDAPDNDVTLTNISTGKTVSGKFRFHNTLQRPDKVFCFCTTMEFDQRHIKFGSACIEILDPEKFRQRLKRALRRGNRISVLDRPILLANAIHYYRENRAAPSTVDIKNPKHLPFLKRDVFSDEKEFRFVFARARGFQLREIVANENYSELEEVRNMADNQITIEIGSIKDIARRVES